MTHDIDMHSTGTANEILAAIFKDAGGEQAELRAMQLNLDGAIFPSVYKVETIAAVTTAAAALAAANVARRRGFGEQRITVNSRHAQAAFQSERYQQLDAEPVRDTAAGAWGYYKSKDQHWMQLHVGFEHHHAGHMALLGCAVDADRKTVAEAVAQLNARDYEDAMAAHMLPGVKMRSREQWAESAQGKAVAQLPLLEIIKIGDAPALDIAAGERPLSGLRVLDLTKVIAGPVCGRTLAEHGAQVMRVHAPRLPFMNSLVLDTGRGKRSCHLDLLQGDDKAQFTELLKQAHVMTQGYRPGAIAAHGFSPEQVAAIRPGIVCLSLCAWSHVGPWSQRRGFDSLVQMASGIADTGAKALNSQNPGPLPCQALDHGTGYLAAFGVMMALAKQQQQGGSWHVRLSLAQTGEWLQRMGRTDSMHLQTPDGAEFQDLMDSAQSPFGQTRFIKPVAQFSSTPAYWERGSVPLGHDPAQWTV